MSSSHEVYMQAAIDCAESARYLAPPNPWVGCVLVKNRIIIGQGASDPAGGPHAEAKALAQAGPDARGATAYVTLEPCSHTGRTPPCSQALIQAGVSEVVVGLEDPDDRVQGRGLSELEAAGIRVLRGVLSNKVETQLRPYLHHRRTQKAFCCLKTALSLDGRTAAEDGTSQWITGAEARANAHQLRAASQAILVGSGTVLADQPRLTVRQTQFLPTNPPLRVILDRRGRISAEGPLFDTSEAPTLILTSSNCPSSARKAWESKGVEVETLSGPSLGEVPYLLGKRGILQLMVEGGAQVHGAFLAEGLVDHLVIYYGNCLLGPTGRPAFTHPVFPSMEGLPRWKLLDVRALGENVRMDYILPPA